MGTKLVGLCGYMGSGKTTAAKCLAEQGYVVLPLASVLKEMLLTFGLSEDQVRGGAKEVPDDLLGGKTPRQAMQLLGTEWGRMLIDEDVWLRAWWRKAGGYLSVGRSVVCDDVRFPNEFAFIRAQGGRIIQIDRPGCSPGDHASEQIHFTPNFLVNNTTTIFGLDQELGKITRLEW